MARGMCPHGVPWDDDVEGGVPRCEQCMSPVPHVDALHAENTALRARVAQLEAALRGLQRCGFLECHPTCEGVNCVPHATRTALAASPDDAGRRWEAMRALEAAVRAYCDVGSTVESAMLYDDMSRALARLDAEGKP